MADLSVDFVGIKSPNPFWLASAPPTNMGSMVERAFDAGWGGAVWKTLGEPIRNVCSRLASVDLGPQRMIGLNNIELITDRPLDVNLREIRECKRKYPKHALIVSLMVESKREAWHEIAKQVEDTGAHGGYCGPAVKPIALNMVSELARDPEVTVPISGIGGISTWRDATEFLLLGATTVQVCTAVMHYGYRIVEDLIDGLSNYLDDKGHTSVCEIIGASTRRVTDWGNLDLNYKTVARIDHAKCIQCNLCHIACEDGAHQCVPFTQIDGKRYPVVDEAECVGCNLCYLVCPVPGCISMVRLDDGQQPLTWRQLTNRQPAPVSGD